MTTSFKLALAFTYITTLTSIYRRFCRSIDCFVMQDLGVHGVYRTVTLIFTMMFYQQMVMNKLIIFRVASKSPKLQHHHQLPKHHSYLCQTSSLLDAQAVLQQLIKPIHYRIIYTNF
ncbi:hypothetical protein M758_UG102000 [Ceratodon purpureus]|nr:hypothetical protein M758_UG102000 [Ceratodon purpureus]